MGFSILWLFKDFIIHMWIVIFDKGLEYTISQPYVVRRPFCHRVSHFLGIIPWEMQIQSLATRADTEQKDLFLWSSKMLF
jgi:hypothetical protein